jgi:hypothetical protein
MWVFKSIAMANILQLIPFYMLILPVTNELIHGVTDQCWDTRPDISMVVQVLQCARLCFSPKAIHELAIKQIARYLLITWVKGLGLILPPKSTLSLDMYVDVDFAGRWHPDYAELHDSVLYRLGCIVTFCGCPITWCSKLQSEITLSTTESEYITLSTATRDLLPLRGILNDNDYSFISLQHG